MPLSEAAAIRPGDTVLEPSAGTGMLAVMAECALGKGAAGNLHLNEIAPTRARLLTLLFPQAVVTAFNAEAIADRLHDVRPTVVLMNPPFSATPGVDRIRHDADLRHLRSALSMLPPGGALWRLPRPTACRGMPHGRTPSAVSIRRRAVSSPWRSMGVPMPGAAPDSIRA